MGIDKAYRSWLDRAGRFSARKAATLLGAILPAAWLAAADVPGADLSLDEGPSATAIMLAVGLGVAASRLGRVAVARSGGLLSRIAWEHPRNLA